MFFSGAERKREKSFIYFREHYYAPPPAAAVETTAATFTQRRNFCGTSAGTRARRRSVGRSVEAVVVGDGGAG